MIVCPNVTALGMNASSHVKHATSVHKTLRTRIRPHWVNIVAIHKIVSVVADSLDQTSALRVLVRGHFIVMKYLECSCAMSLELLHNCRSTVKIIAIFVVWFPCSLWALCSHVCCTSHILIVWCPRNRPWGPIGLWNVKDPPHCLDNRLTVNCEILATCSSTYSSVRTLQEEHSFSIKWSYPRNRPWRPIGLWDVKDPTLSRQSAHR
jgi:hypothetical protein